MGTRASRPLGPAAVGARSGRCLPSRSAGQSRKLLHRAGVLLHGAVCGAAQVGTGQVGRGMINHNCVLKTSL